MANYRNRTNKRRNYRRNRNGGDGFRKSNPSMGRTNWKPRSLPNGYQTTGALVKRLRFPINSGQGHGITSASGLIQSYVYRTNDCYDPYTAIGGAQPDGFAYYMGLYEKFIVLGSKAVINFTGYNLASPMMVGCLASTSVTATNPDQMSKGLLGQTRILSPDRPQAMIKSYYSYKRTGARGANDADHLQGTASASPSSTWFLHIGGWGLNAQNTDAWFTGHIDYLVMFIDPKMIGR